VSSLSDPSRASRRDRRRAQKVIDAAYAAGRLTAADRALRTQRVEAAHTVGDLVMITRDLRAGSVTATEASPALGSAIDPSVLESMRVRPAASTTSAGAHASTRIVTMPKGMRRFVAIAVASVVGLTLLCGLGIVGMVVSTFNASDNGRPTPTTSPSSQVAETRDASEPASGDASLYSADGWRAFVSAVRAESGTTEVYDAVVYPEYAAVALVSGDRAERRVFRDGDFLESFRALTPATGNRVDLAAITPEVIARLPELTADRLGVDDPTGTYMIINALPTDPRISVYVESEGGSQYRTYALDGTPQS
jgi:hypothetical protein